MFEPERIPTNKPIIVDESYASPETAALHEEGYEEALVARVDSPKDHISMSSYGKSQAPQIHGYDPARTYPESTYPYTAPIYGSQPPAPASSTAPVYHNATQLTPMAYPSNQVRPPFDDQAGPYLNVGSTPTPDVTSYNPQKGTTGTKVFVYISSMYELLTSSTPIFFLIFGQRKC